MGVGPDAHARCGSTMKLLDKLPGDGTLKFLHKVIDGVCGRTYPRYQDYNTVWNLTEWMEILEQSATYFKDTVGKGLTDEQALLQLGELSSESQRAVLTCLKGRKEDIRYSLIERTNAICSAQLLDFDWQLKLALSSDKLSMLQMPLLNLDLDVSETGVIKQLSIEMNKEELQNLVNALEAANKVSVDDFVILLLVKTDHC